MPLPIDRSGLRARRDFQFRATRPDPAAPISPQPCWRFAYRLIAICMVALSMVGCGKLLTTRAPLGERFDQPLVGLDNGELGEFQRGQTQFRRGFAINEGLGPIFNNRSCASCHSGDGRGVPGNILTRFSRGTDLVPGEGGPQLQALAIPGAEPERLPAGVDVSRRLPPPVFGMGLIEAISDSSILSHSDPTDSDGDGISGRPNWVTPPPYVPASEPGGASPSIGRFGRKAQVSALLQQVVEAYHQDMGITSSYRPTENINPLASHPAPDQAPEPETSDGQVDDVVNYCRMLAPPEPGAWTDMNRRGQTVFNASGCSSCHVATLRTGAHEIETLANRDVTLYSDLLLHDLGATLADQRPDGSADGYEWRTAPLWGMRIVRLFLNGQMFLLHDGRARSTEEAILLHGGEAAAARDSFAALPATDRAALIDFVESR